MKPIKIKLAISKDKIYTFDAQISFLIWAIICILFPVLAIFKEKIIPKYFFLDANTIYNFMLANSSFTPGDSYASTAAFYSIFDVGRQSIFFPIIASAVIIYAFFSVFKKLRIESISFIELGVFAYYLLLSIVYMTLLSKDFIVLLVLLPFAYLAKKGKRGLLIWSIMAIIYSYLFRSYWVLFIAEFWVLYILLNYMRKPVYVFIFAFLSLLMLAIAFKAGLGVDVDNFRNIVNDTRMDSSDVAARSMIQQWISGGGFIGGWLNVCITWLTFMVPIPLILELSPYYLVISALLILLYYKFWKIVKIELVLKNNHFMRACICLILAFTIIQSVFEPDYGSYVRHLAPFYPIFFYVIFGYHKKRT